MDLLRTEPTPSSSRFPYTTLFRSGTVSGRSNGRVRPRGRRRLSEAGGRLQPRAAIARDEGAQLHVRAVRVVALQPGPDPRLVVPAVERRVFGAGEVGLELLQRRQSFTDESPHGGRVRRPERSPYHECG